MKIAAWERQTIRPFPAFKVVACSAIVQSPDRAQ
jgi:hypothetical protein